MTITSQPFRPKGGCVGKWGVGRWWENTLREVRPFYEFCQSTKFDLKNSFDWFASTWLIITVSEYPHIVTHKKLLKRTNANPKWRQNDAVNKMDTGGGLRHHRDIIFKLTFVSTAKNVESHVRVTLYNVRRRTERSNLMSKFDIDKTLLRPELFSKMF